MKVFLSKDIELNDIFDIGNKVFDFYDEGTQFVYLPYYFEIVGEGINKKIYMRHLSELPENKKHLINLK